MTRWCWLWKSRPRMMSQQIVGRTFTLVNAYLLPSTTISVRRNPNDFTVIEVDVIRTWCEEGYKVELSLLQIVSEWINAVKTFPPTITGIDAFVRSGLQDKLPLLRTRTELPMPRRSRVYHCTWTQVWIDRPVENDLSTLEYYRGSARRGSNEVIHVKLRKLKSARFELISSFMFLCD